MTDDGRRLLTEASAVTLREVAYRNSDRIYSFMKASGIGESQVGRLMDLEGLNRCGVAVHRAYGHHLVADLPVASPERIPAFVSHVGSDVFTKQGIPILPGSVCKRLGYSKALTTMSSNQNWNMVNGFDIATGGIAIVGSGIFLAKALKGEATVETPLEYITGFGTAGMELAVGISTCNPLLVVAAGIQLVGSVAACFNAQSNKVLEETARLKAGMEVLADVSSSMFFGQVCFGAFVAADSRYLEAFGRQIARIDEAGERMTKAIDKV
jgi:hypothetical protein